MKKVITALIALAIVLGGALVPAAASASTPTPPAPSARTMQITASAARTPEVSQGSAGQATERIARASTGQYEYICIGADGSSWSLRLGEPTKDCHGSYLHQYINGRLVHSYHLVYNGGNATYVSGTCLLAVVGEVGLFVWPPSSELGWVVLGSLAAGTFINECS